MDNFEQAIKREFLEEASEIVEELESCFLALEKNPQQKDLLDRIFRLVHTAKGSAMAAGFMSLGEYAHTVETLLSLLREGSLVIDKALVDLLIRANDLLKVFVSKLCGDFGASVATESLTTEIRRITAPFEQRIQAGDILSAGFHVFEGDPEGPTPAIPSPQPAISAVGRADQVVASSSHQAKPLVLLVDDEPNILHVLQELITGVFYDVCSATSGADALNIIASRPIDVIITDFRMPNMDGREFISKVRDMDRNIPVIFMSGYAGKSDLIAFMQLGAHDFIDKPVDMKRLLFALENAIKIKKARENITRLSILNFRAYTRISRIMFETKHKDAVIKERWAEVEACLDEISELTREVLISSFKKPKA